MVYRKLPDELPDKRPLLDAMGYCRDAANRASNQVKPFGLTHRTLSLLTGAIDTVAWFLTGSTSHFHSMGAPDPRDSDPRG